MLIGDLKSQPAPAAGILHHRDIVIQNRIVPRSNIIDPLWPRGYRYAAGSDQSSIDGQSMTPSHLLLHLQMDVPGRTALFYGNQLLQPAQVGQVDLQGSFAGQENRVDGRSCQRWPAQGLVVVVGEEHDIFGLGAAEEKQNAEERQKAHLSGIDLSYP